MQCHLAAFDPAHRSAGGTNWAWHHPAIPLRVLDAFYYDCASKHWPTETQCIPADSLRGGCASVAGDWVAWYRFVDGGRDKNGRPGRNVLLAAFVRREVHYCCDCSGIVDSPQFQQLAQQAKSKCPIPTPNALELYWDSLPIEMMSAAAERLQHKGNDTVADKDALRLVAEICCLIPRGQQFDCYFVKQGSLARVAFTQLKVNGSHPHDPRPRETPAFGDHFEDLQGRRHFLTDRLRRTFIDCVVWTRSRSVQLVVGFILGLILGAVLGALLGWQVGRSADKDSVVQQ